ncbi:MAG: hypothetical protein HFACDABA_00138 [Anaerolineales bacterium]|nr:hypothetical protein [Anaerolineales bacterium]
MQTFVIVQGREHKPASLPRVKYCESFLCRLRGLTFRAPLTPDEGLLLVFGRDSRVDSSIHMLGVSFDIAVFWINSEMKIVDKIVAGAWKPAFFPKEPARYVLEVHAGRINDFEIGQAVEIQNA